MRREGQGAEIRAQGTVEQEETERLRDEETKGLRDYKFTAADRKTARPQDCRTKGGVWGNAQSSKFQPSLKFRLAKQGTEVEGYP